jgi:Uma2 family endonuclease
LAGFCLKLSFAPLRLRMTTTGSAYRYTADGIIVINQINSPFIRAFTGIQMIHQNPKIKLTYEDYCLFPDDGNRHEVINGLHYMSPAPSTNHQSVSKWLLHFLFATIELRGLGKVFYAPVDVQLGPHDIVQPDLVVVLNKSKAGILPSRIQGPPDLVVEILSPSTSQNDLTLKRRLYEQSGVSEYWIVDPDQRRVDQLVLTDGEFQVRPAAAGECTLAIRPDVTIPVAEIFGR